MIPEDTSSIPGWYDYADFYQTVADRLKDGDTIAEVGVWLGRSIIDLALKIKRQGKRVKILAVDSFKGSDADQFSTVSAHGGSIRSAFEENLKRFEVEGMFEILEGDSAEMASQVPAKSLAFCFIDADHQYESVRRDVLAWEPKVKDGGIMAGHDAHMDSVKRAVQETVRCSITGDLWRKV